jgi:hypothetical protein
MTARDKWTADYRAARAVLAFDRAFFPGELSSLSEGIVFAGAMPFSTYCAALCRSGDFLSHPRHNGRFGVGGRLLRPIDGPEARLPA